ncbi:MAG: hypothetical protein IT343_22065 [Candidatus Melainabacteria bacterium]|jgi:hypothetical protein|nr:hypothetical protein [Candidatus Melainabacteria bacterium]
MEQPLTYRPSYFVNPEGSTALQNLLNEAKADFFNNRYGTLSKLTNLPNLPHIEASKNQIEHEDGAALSTQA